MQKDIFYCLGKLIYRFRWLVIIFWLLLFLSCIPFITKLMDPFNAIGFTDPKSESVQANETLNNKLGYSYNQFIVMYSSDKLLATNPKFLQQIKTSLDGLKNISAEHKISYPSLANKQISPDKHAAYAVILFNSDQEADSELLEKFKANVKKPPELEMQVGGEPIFLDDTKTQTQRDLYKAEYVATPAAIITMILVFGSLVAASLPIILGGVCALIILFALYGLAQVFSLSVFTVNIALLLGLCLSLDYALLIVSRYRDELLRENNVVDAIAITLATAGKAVFFSGIAVLISLSALLLFPINVLFSVGMGGLAAVVVSLAVAIILLPAVLAVLNTGVNRLAIPFLMKKHAEEKYHWHGLITKAVKRPFLFLICTLALLLFLGFPFLHAKYGISDFRILPADMESRQVFETFKSKFGESKLAPILVIVKTPGEKIMTRNNIGYLYDFADKIKKDLRVDQITSIVSTEPRLSKNQYQTLYTGSHLSPALKKLVDNTTRDNMTVFTIVSKFPSNSATTTELIKTLRASQLGNNLTVEVTGGSANTIDVLHSISQTFPYAFLWIIGFTYLILFIFLRSLVLPLKAILTTILSLCASYGILVLVFQQGYLHELLNFEPQGMLDISLLIIIFCALFGISMDYEVFLLTRIKEYYERTGNNVESIITGIDRSSRIITSAAIIVIIICFSFMAADILIVKAFGLGIAVAVFMDAFIIRTILVPAAMTILNGWNWYLPKWLDKILPKIAFDPEHFSKHDKDTLVTTQKVLSNRR